MKSATPSVSTLQSAMSGFCVCLSGHTIIILFAITTFGLLFLSLLLLAATALDEREAHGLDGAGGKRTLTPTITIRELCLRAFLTDSMALDSSRDVGRVRRDGDMSYVMTSGLTKTIEISPVADGENQRKAQH